MTRFDLEYLNTPRGRVATAIASGAAVQLIDACRAMIPDVDDVDVAHGIALELIRQAAIQAVMSDEIVQR